MFLIVFIHWGQGEGKEDDDDEGEEGAEEDKEEGRFSIAIPKLPCCWRLERHKYAIENECSPCWRAASCNTQLRLGFESFSSRNAFIVNVTS